jgi:mannose-6-phosphate isomerase-like protein (cupin superfamily)
MQENKKKENSMKRSLLLLGAAAALLAAWSAGRLQGQKTETVLFVSANHSNYSAMSPGVSAAPIWGDHNTGAHGTFTRFQPGEDSGLHLHTNDVWIVVLRGAYLYKDEAGEKRVAAGDFLRVPGGDKKDGALFYEESSGKFDLVPVK